MKAFNEHGTKVVETVEVGEYILHGDVIIQRVSELPSEFAQLPVERNQALAYGEVTGHVHQLIGKQDYDFDVRVDEVKKERHLKIVNPVALKHQEHSPIVLPPGNYRIGIQREYDPFTKIIRQVAD